MAITNSGASFKTIGAATVSSGKNEFRFFKV